MEIVWIRHGEPERIAPGSGVAADPQLTAAGRDQAKRLADWLAFEQIDAVLTSPLRRAVETAEPLAAALGLPAETFEGIVEYDRDSDHYIPTEELRVTRDERWTAMVEGRWDEFARAPIEGWPAQDGARIQVGDTIHDVFLWVVPQA